jgi:PilZ domain
MPAWNGAAKVSAMLAQQHTPPDGVERRRYRRVPLLHSAALHDGERVIDCLIRDISTSGARLDVPQPAALPETVMLDIAEAGRLNGRIVWRQEGQAGFEFLDEPAIVKSRIVAAWGPHAAFE